MSNRFTRSITLNGETVTYMLEYKNIKNVNIHITPEKGLYISAPFRANLQRIDDYLKDNSEKVLSALKQAKAAAKSPQKQTHTEQRKITLSGRIVNYELNYKNVKRLNLSISPVKGVRISAPCSVRVKDIERFMVENTDFIIRALNKYEQMSDIEPKKQEFAEGETMYFLGEKKTIHIIKSSRTKAEVHGSRLYLYVTDPTSFASRQAAADTFIKQKSEEIIPNMCLKLYPRFKAKGIEYPKEIRFRKMVSCWGNCRPARSILTFNTHLIQLPEKCIEQVICHEFTHFLHADHSKAFYAQLAEFMPDWKMQSELMKKLQSDIIFR